MRLLSAYHPLFSQLQKVFYGFLFGLLFFGNAMTGSGQSIVYQDLPDSTTIGIDSMPRLMPFVADSVIVPYYQYLWIFSDGNFINGTRDSIVRHVYAVPAGLGTAEVTARALATGLYSDDIGDPPPRVIPGDSTEVKERPFTPAFKSAVDSADFLSLQKNHLNIVPGDTTAWIFSYKHNWQEFDAPLSGYLLFFYNGPVQIEEVTQKAKGGKKYESVLPGGVQPRGAFQYHDNISPLPKSGFNTLAALSLPVGSTIEDHYGNVAVFRYDSLIFGEERHLFFEMVNDPALLTKIPEKTKGTVDFMAVMTSDIQGITFPITDPEKVAILSKTGAGDFVASSVNTTDIFLGNAILDVQESSPVLSRAHDPNQLTTWACACPANADGEQQITGRIDFLNDGGAPTSDIYLTFYLAPGLNPNSVPVTPLDINPEPKGPTSLEDNVEIIERTDEKIVWHLKGFRLESTLTHGVGHPSTTGHLSFSILTDPGVTAADLPPLRASIVFDDASPVYTLPVEPILLTYADGEGEGKALQCDTCDLPAESGGFLPLWLLILLLLLLLFLIIWLLLRRN